MFKKILWIGDAAVSSGFGKCTTEILKTVGQHFEIAVLGVNYIGDPHPLPYRIYPAGAGRNPYGLNRLKYVTQVEQPDAIVIQTNPWNIPEYLKALDKAEWHVPTIGVIAVEGKNCCGYALNGLDRAIFWTHFGAMEAVRGGMKNVPFDVIPLGVDLEVFKPGDRLAARRALGLPPEVENGFIVTNVNRNQNRKRLDLSISAFAKWIKDRRINDAYLYLHTLPGSSVGLDVEHVVKYYGISGRVVWSEPVDIFKGADTSYLVATYQAADVCLSTALGEGWGLTTMEGMACGVPQIVTDYAAIPEWAGESVARIPVVSEGVMPDVFGMIGGTPDVDEIAKTLDIFYHDESWRDAYSASSLMRVRQSQFRWENIGANYVAVIRALEHVYAAK